MKTIENFSACLQNAVTAAGISVSELARLMNIKNRNELFRILNDKASYKKQREFFEKLKRADVLPLDDRLWAQMEEALEVTRLGEYNYRISHAMHEFVMKEAGRVVPARVTVLDKDGGEREMDFAAFLHESWGERVRLTMTGCFHSGVLHAIENELPKEDSQDSVQIVHYLAAEDEEIIQAVTVLQPMIHSGCYNAYTLPVEKASGEEKAIYKNNVILMHTVAAGVSSYRYIQMTDSDTLRAVCFEDERIYRYVLDTIETHKEKMPPLKAQFSQPVAPEDYIWYTEQYGNLEKGCRLYDVKSDVPINYIHPDILIGSVTDGFRENGFGESDELVALVQALYDVQLKRWQNFFQSHKVTHTVFTYESMRRFAETGKQSDHFYAMRPYTKAERFQILTFLRMQTVTNPYFTVYFFKPGLNPVQSEIGCYEGKGVLLTKENTDYRLDGGHAETLVTNHEFCSKFKSYFLNTLLTQEVVSKEETLAILDELIAMCC